MNYELKLEPVIFTKILNTLQFMVKVRNNFFIFFHK